MVGEKVYYEEQNYCVFGTVIKIENNGVLDLAWINCNGFTTMYIETGLTQRILSSPISYKVCLLDQLKPINKKQLKLF